MKKTTIVFCIFLFSISFMPSCCTPSKYSETCIEAGETIVETLNQYVKDDQTLNTDEKKEITESCEQFLKLLKQED